MNYLRKCEQELINTNRRIGGRCARRKYFISKNYRLNMLVVKTKVKESKIHGRGLFAEQNIKKGQIIWRWDPLLDLKIPKKKLLQLPSFTQKFIKYYSYLNDKDEFVLCGDGARYINSSDKPNMRDIITSKDKLLGSEGKSVASRNIKKGEEITSRYLRFDKKGRAVHIA